jgi:protein subunit release factor B
MSRELIFSVTESDCRFDYYRGSGKGGQKRNKTSNAVRCTHPPSGAVGQAEDTRSQYQNKRIAFQRMAGSDAFKQWHRIEVARKTGREREAREAADRAMQPHNLRIEGKSDAGLWTEIE